MNKFVDLFKQYGWTVEQLGDNSFIAYENVFFVAFSCVPCGSLQNELISAVSYFIRDKDSFIEAWKYYNNHCSMFGVDIGTYAFNDFFTGNSKFVQHGALGNHDHSYYEVELWLKHIHTSAKLRERKKSNNG